MNLLSEYQHFLSDERRYSPATVKAYMGDIEHFIATLSLCEGEEFDPSIVSREDVAEWIMQLTDDGRKPTSVNRAISSVRSLFRWLQERGYIANNPTLQVSSQRLPVRPPTFVRREVASDLVEQLSSSLSPFVPRPLSNDKEALLSWNDQYRAARNATIVLLFYATGLRLAEVEQLTVEDAGNDYTALRVLGKGNKVRIVPLIEAIRKILMQYCEKWRPEICNSRQKALFLTEKGEAMSRWQMERVVKRVLAENNVQGKNSPHVLRHTFATHLLGNGADMRDIQELMGHTTLTTTQVYTHNTAEELKQAYNKAHPRADKQ